VALERAHWRRWQRRVDPRRLVFLDETGLNTKMLRHYGRAQGGARCFDRAPHGHWHTSTFIAALRCERVEAPWLLDGPMHALAFEAYCRHVLGPTLREGDIVICDNLSSHKSLPAKQAIEQAGARLRHLPPYSPDLNPIEMLFAKIKAHLRARATRTIEQLTQALAQTLTTLDDKLCSNLFKHANYQSI